MYYQDLNKQELKIQNQYEYKNNQALRIENQYEYELRTDLIDFPVEEYYKYQETWGQNEMGIRSEWDIGKNVQIKIRECCDTSNKDVFNLYAGEIIKTGESPSDAIWGKGDKCKFYSIEANEWVGYEVKRIMIHGDELGMEIHHDPTIELEQKKKEEKKQRYGAEDIMYSCIDVTIIKPIKLVKKKKKK
eukprot:142075_1